LWESSLICCSEVHLFQFEGIESTTPGEGQLCLFHRIVNEAGCMGSVSGSNKWKEIPSLYIPLSLSGTTSAQKNMKEHFEESIEPMIKVSSNHEKRQILQPGRWR
jgi:hypothetical protein